MGCWGSALAGLMLQLIRGGVKLPCILSLEGCSNLPLALLNCSFVGWNAPELIAVDAPPPSARPGGVRWAQAETGRSARGERKEALPSLLTSSIHLVRFYTCI